MKTSLTIMISLAGSLLLQSCGQQTSFTAADKASVSSAQSKTSDVVEIDNEIDLTVKMPVCAELKLSCVQMAKKYKRTLDIAQMKPEQSIFVKQGDIFIYSSGANKNLKKLDTSANVGMVQTCGIDIEDAYARSGVNVYLYTNIKLVHASITVHLHKSIFQNFVAIQP